MEFQHYESPLSVDFKSSFGFLFASYFLSTFDISKQSQPARSLGKE